MSMTDQQEPEQSTRPSWQHLFFAFFRLGLTAFGGPAMILHIREMAVGREKWLAKERFQEGVAMAQAVPGATAMQVAAFVGLRVRGAGGAVAAYVGFGLPAFVLMLALSALYARTHTLPAVVSAFSGLQALIVSVVTHAAWSFGRTTVLGWRQGGIALMAAILFWLALTPPLILLISALLGLTLPQSQDTRPLASAEHSPMWKSLLPFGALVAGTVAVFGLLMSSSSVLGELALLMARIDLMAFGGGFASVPFMFHEIVEVRSWLTGPVFLDGIALGQFTPGPIVITATFVGYLLHGMGGAVVATVAIFLPSLLIVIGIAPWFSRLRTLRGFQQVLAGVLCSFVGLLVTVAIRFAMQVQWDGVHLFLALAAFAALWKKVDILWVILAGGLLSILLV